MKKFECNHYMLSKFNPEAEANPVRRAIDDEEYSYIITEDSLSIGIHVLRYVTRVVMIASHFIPINENRRRRIGVVFDRYEIINRNFPHKNDFIKYYIDNPPKRFCFCDEPMFQRVLKQYDMQTDWIVFKISQ